MRIAVAVVVFVAGCKFEIPPEDPARCSESHDSCVCLIPSGMTEGTCVECIDSGHCATATAPVCGGDHRCHACSSNNDCGMGACLEDGACASPSQVILAAPNGIGTAGCGTTPGQECSIAQALVEVGPPRVIIRLDPGTYGVTAADGLDIAKNATLAARGSTITRNGGTGPLVTVRPGQTLKLVGGTLRGLGASDGIRCDSGIARVHEAVIESLSQSGIRSTECELTVSRSTIRNSLQGGINMIGLAKAVEITNNFVYRNGTGGSSVGGMALRLVPTASKVEFNTVVDNDADLGIATSGGIACEGTGYDLAYNLVYRNTGGVTGDIQVNGTCTSMSSYKHFTPRTENVVGFENPTGANPSYRLTLQSPITTIRDGIDCRDLVDHEGDPRPQGARCDYGADEFRAGQ